MASNNITREEIKKINILYKNGKSCIEIGEILNRDPSTIRRQLKNEGIYENKTRYISKEELENIKNDYLNGMRPKDLSDKYHRNSGTIINKLREIGVYTDSRLNFTKEDEEFLKENYPIGNWDAIYKRFPNVKKQSIINKASRMGLNADYYFWSEEEENFLKANYFNMSLNELEEKFNYKFSKGSIRTKAWKKFGYSTDDDWTQEEENILINYYSKIPLDEVCKLIPNRTKVAIIGHAKKFKLLSYYNTCTLWTSEQIEYLLDNWQTHSDEELGEFLHKNKQSVMDKRHRLDLYRIDREYGGYTSISKYLRGQTWNWKSQSIKACNNQCIITGSNSFQVHHLYCVSTMIQDIFNENDIIKKEFNEYSPEELETILDLFIQKQNNYPLGICIRKDIHDLYHEIYGKYNNTEEQWNRFEADLLSGKYDDRINLEEKEN